jgi:hypothetical protein
MTSNIPSERPNCEKILKNKQNWALNPKDFEINQNQKSILKSINTNEKFSVNSILQVKFNYVYQKYPQYKPTFDQIELDQINDPDDDFIGFSFCI